MNIHYGLLRKNFPKSPHFLPQKSTLPSPKVHDLFLKSPHLKVTPLELFANRGY